MSALIINNSNVRKKIRSCKVSPTMFQFSAILSLIEDLGFLPWGSWEPCSAPCGGGTQQRHRDCTDPSICFPDRKKEIQICNTSACKGKVTISILVVKSDKGSAINPPTIEKTLT